MSLFVKFTHVAATKICLDNLDLNIHNSNKNLWISVLCTEPEHKREVLSLHLILSKQLW